MLYFSRFFFLRLKKRAFKKDVIKGNKMKKIIEI